MNDLLYPAYQKLYNSLNSIDKFNKNNNFFKNISSLDSFLSEYRNITFVIQKSLTHTDFLDDYNRLRDIYLTNHIGKWFVAQRNSVTKEAPFLLEKGIHIKLYSPSSSQTIFQKVYTIENDIKFSSLENTFKELFYTINTNEIFFSCEYVFSEKGKQENLFELINSGIKNMMAFLGELKSAINQDSELVTETEKEIDRIDFLKIPPDFLFIDDYVYYKDDDEFQRGSRMGLIIGKEFNKFRTPIQNLLKTPYFDRLCNLFEDFTMMHVSIMTLQKSLMPTFIKIYSDGTFNIDSFTSSIKTTVYRKINDIAQEILSESIVQVIFLTEMRVIQTSDNEEYAKLSQMTSKERVNITHKEHLCSFSIDKFLKTKVLSFDSQRLNDPKYIASVFQNRQSLDGDINFLNPLKNSFIKSQKAETQ